MEPLPIPDPMEEERQRRQRMIASMPAGLDGGGVRFGTDTFFNGNPDLSDTFNSDADTGEGGGDESGDGF